jgi:hypothetical protein
MRQLTLGKVVLAADAEHDLQIRAALELRCRGVGEEPEELPGFVGARRHPQGLHGQAPSTWNPAGADSRSRLAPPRVAMPPPITSRIGEIRPYSGAAHR